MGVGSFFGSSGAAGLQSMWARKKRCSDFHCIPFVGGGDLGGVFSM
jgi:hypothetical protein